MSSACNFQLHSGKKKKSTHPCFTPDHVSFFFLFPQKFQHHSCSPALTCSALPSQENHINVISIWLIIDQFRGTFLVPWFVTILYMQLSMDTLISVPTCAILFLEHSYLCLQTHVQHRSAICAQLEGLSWSLWRLFPSRNSIKSIHAALCGDACHLESSDSLIDSLVYLVCCNMFSLNNNKQNRTQWIHGHV